MARLIPVLMYHAIADQRSPIGLSRQVFAGQMASLGRSGFQVCTLEALVNCLQDGQALPARAAVITFDDGFACLEENAFPVLAEFGFPATVFLVTQFCGGANDWPGQPPGLLKLPLLSWEQVRAWQSPFLQFGSHSVSHPRLDLLTREQTQAELVESRRLLEEQIERPVTCFAYPYGRITPQVVDQARQVYRGAVTTRLGQVSAAGSPHTLARVDAAILQNPLVFQLLGTRLLSLYLALRGRLRQGASRLLRRAWV